MLDDAIYDDKVKRMAAECVAFLTNSEDELNRTEQVAALCLMVYCYMKTMKEKYGEPAASFENQCERLFKTIHVLEAEIGQGIVDLLAGGNDAND